MTIQKRPDETIFAEDAITGEVRPFPNLKRGFGIAFDQSNGFPVMENFNGLIQLMFQNIMYLVQNGFSTWSSETDYPVDAFVKHSGRIYQARRNNKGKNPSTNQQDWTYFFGANALEFLEPLIIDGLRVSINNASTTKVGAARFATTTETNNASNVLAAVTPKQAKDIAEISGLGSGQKWFGYSDPDRRTGEFYTNNTGKPILVHVTASGSLGLEVDGVAVCRSGEGGVERDDAFVSAIIPPGSRYRVFPAWFQFDSLLWAELRSSK